MADTKNKAKTVFQIYTQNNNEYITEKLIPHMKALGYNDLASKVKKRITAVREVMKIEGSMPYENRSAKTQKLLQDTYYIREDGSDPVFDFVNENRDFKL